MNFHISMELIEDMSLLG